MATHTFESLIKSSVERDKLLRKLREINQRTQSALYWYRADEDGVEYLRKAIDDVRAIVTNQPNK